MVTPKDCSRCHPDEVTQYEKSKHANTLEIIWKIDPWLNEGMNSDWERTTGCFYCHGTVLEQDDKGRLAPQTWPNVGVGRLNLDESKGSCTSCHTRHRFSVMEARKPEACGQCHLGPDHPQIEIYMESKHGDIYTAFGDGYNWDSAPGTWTPGVDYRGPTCASCHMSGAGETMTTHMGTAMMAPDYSWWHGFYECKHRFNEFMAEAGHLLGTGQRAHVYKDFPNADGDTTRPEKLFGTKE